MWTHVSLNVEIVWDDALWRAVSIWQDDDVSEPIVMEKSGRVPLGADTTPENALYRATLAMQSAPAARAAWVPAD